MTDKRKNHSRRLVDVAVDKLANKAISSLTTEINSLYSLLERVHPYISDSEIQTEVMKVLLSEKLKRTNVNQ